jgi:hypothetical protein
VFLLVEGERCSVQEWYNPTESNTKRT